MFSMQQIANVWVHFFNESLQNILSQEVSLVQLSQKLEQLVNQTGGEVLKAILEQADEAIYAAIKSEHRGSLTLAKAKKCHEASKIAEFFVKFSKFISAIS